MDRYLVVSMPVGGDEGMGTLEDLDFRHALERRLDTVLRARALGHVDGGGAGLGCQEIFMVVDRGTWRPAWDAVRATLEEQGLLGRPGLRATLEDNPVAQVLCTLPLGSWHVERLTRDELARLVEQLPPHLDQALADHLHLAFSADQAVQDTAAEAYDALQELFDAALTAWGATIDPDQSTAPLNSNPDV
jgi:hypothetical protein